MDILSRSCGDTAGAAGKAYNVLPASCSSCPQGPEAATAHSLDELLLAILSIPENFSFSLPPSIASKTAESFPTLVDPSLFEAPLQPRLLVEVDLSQASPTGCADNLLTARATHRVPAECRRLHGLAACWADAQSPAISRLSGGLIDAVWSRASSRALSLHKTQGPQQRHLWLCSISTGPAHRRSGTKSWPNACM